MSWGKQKPRPDTSIPALFETVVGPEMEGALCTDLIRIFGIPYRPKPPARSVELDYISPIIFSAEGSALLISLS